MTTDPTLLSKDATEHTRRLLQTEQFRASAQDWERARRGFLAAHPTGRIESPDGRLVWDTSRYEFLTGDAPSTVNPSLWDHAKLDAIHGLFEVADGVWQVRGYDISNVTFVASATGWIVIDPLTTEFTARAALDLVNSQLGVRPVIAVIYTHSHADHFGGVLGVTTQADVDAGRCIVVAPEGFLRETVSENVIAGFAMARRGVYQFGPLLAPGPLGHVDSGLGNAMPIGQPGLIAPTHDITRTGEEMNIDGVRIVFQLTPETEAPAEMNFFFPEKRWLCMAENCSQTMHNLVPIRGAQARDALAWSKYINEAIELFGAQTEVLFTSHHWPTWGADEIGQFLALQRDLYRWMHDQTMRHANHGLTPNEIAATLRLPAVFEGCAHTRGYYGDLVHNCKAVYQRYLSWYDANPAHLNQHTPVEAGRRYVEFIGGAQALLDKAGAAFAEGDYRWVAEVVNHLVFADPTNVAARVLQADALEQLGYQAESSTFRNAYLTGAMELRQGPPPERPAQRHGLVAALTIELIFDSIAVRLQSERLDGVSTRINWRFTDIDEDWVVGVEHHALHASKSRHDSSAKATITMTRAQLLDVLSGTSTFVELITSQAIGLEGDPTALRDLFGNLDSFKTGFPIVEP